MKGKAILIVGTTGSGKSTVIKRMIHKVHDSRLMVYDVNGEYFEGEPLPDVQDFLEMSLNTTDSVIVFEEGTAFFSNRGRSDKMTKLLVKKRHDRNFIIIVFHSIRFIPHYIFDLINYVFVLQTNDTTELVEKKHAILLSAFNKVMARSPTVYPRVNMEIVKIN